jgi:hypothetical protein
MSLPQMRTRLKFFLAPGLFCLLGAGYLLFEDYQFRSTARTAEGTVVELIRTTRDGNRIWLPKVRFTTKAGRDKTFTDEANRSFFGHYEGQTVTVLYQRGGNDPRLDTLTGRFGIPSLISMMGLILTIVGIRVQQMPEIPSEE